MAVSLKLMLALIFLGISCKSVAFSIDENAKIGTEDKDEMAKEDEAEVIRKIETELARQFKAELSRGKKAKMESDDETETYRDIESDHLAIYNKTQVNRQIGSEFARNVEGAGDIVHAKTWRDNGKIIDGVLGRNSFIFGVRACKDAYIFLYQKGESTFYGYTVHIGANQNSMSNILLQLHDKVVTSKTTSYLDCHNLRFFWVTWFNGLWSLKNYVTVGKGAVTGVDKFLTYSGIQDITINSVLVSTPSASSSAPGYWLMFKDSDL